VGSFRPESHTDAHMMRTSMRLREKNSDIVETALAVTTTNEIIEKGI
jgi:hypothetical protein